MYEPAATVPISLTQAGGEDLRFQGRIKVEPEDFIVQEVPAYEPIGEGEHLFLWIEKRDLSAEQLQQHVARTLRIGREHIGMAGLKDKKAVTRQYISLPAQVQSGVDALENEQVRILSRKLHTNKLKTGHLLGNRFEILIRTQDPQALPKAQQVAEILTRAGVPNYFGEQRFGHENETLRLGYDLLAGRKTIAQIPYERRRFLSRLAISSLQSDLFNLVLLERLKSGDLQRVIAGDVMQKRDSGGLFTDENTEVLQRRFETREIVMTGPIFGPKMMSPSGEVLAREDAVLQQRDVDRARFRDFGKIASGTRRALLVYPDEMTCHAETEGIRLAFTLPTGSYATVVLDEFCFVA